MVAVQKGRFRTRSAKSAERGIPNANEVSVAAEPFGAGDAARYSRAASVTSTLGVTGVSIRARVEDAEFLWKHERYEGAFLSALSAVAATARLRYPDRKATKDGDSFRQFLKSGRSGELGVEFRGEPHPMGLY